MFLWDTRPSPQSADFPKNVTIPWCPKNVTSLSEFLGLSCCDNVSLDSVMRLLSYSERHSGSPSRLTGRHVPVPLLWVSHVTSDSPWCPKPQSLNLKTPRWFSMYCWYTMARAQISNNFVQSCPTKNVDTVVYNNSNNKKKNHKCLLCWVSETSRFIFTFKS